MSIPPFTRHRSAKAGGALNRPKRLGFLQNAFSLIHLPAFGKQVRKIPMRMNTLWMKLKVTL
ncbi:MAG: hypothetical protein EB133_12915 [Betaproteobacteria bacterium]|nr:hypothetical protein [Betaproteobacteria bacterium]